MTTNEQAKKPRRERGTGRIWQDGPIWWIQYYLHGQQVRESSGSRKQVVAERLLEKRLGEKIAGVLRGPDRLRYEDLRDGLYAKYRDEGKRSLRTGKDGVRYVAGVKPHVDEFFKGYKASEITTSVLRRFAAKRLAAGTSKGSVDGCLALLRSMFGVAFKDGLLKRNDIPHFPLFHESNPRDIRLNPVEFERLYAALPDYLKAPTRLAYHNGLRHGELFGLRWEDVDWDAGIIQLKGKVTKSGRPRMTPIPEPVMADLKALYPRRETEFVFEHEGKRIKTFYKAWRSALRRAKINPAFVFHGLRYCAASNLTSAGVPRILAQQITGHETDSMFRRYNLVDATDIVEAGRKVAEYIKDGEKKGRMRESEGQDATPRNTLPV